jgi:hypothetical protein
MGVLAFVFALAGCGGGAKTSTQPDIGGTPREVAEAFCTFLDERAAISGDAIGAAFHAAAEQGQLDDAARVTEEIALPALQSMADQLDTIHGWGPGRAFAEHTKPLVDDFSSTATAFIDAPSDEAFEIMDTAAKELRDEAFSGDFARVGNDVFRADCA